MSKDLLRPEIWMALKSGPGKSAKLAEIPSNQFQVTRFCLGLIGVNERDYVLFWCLFTFVFDIFAPPCGVEEMQV